MSVLDSRQPSKHSCIHVNAVSMTGSNLIVHVADHQYSEIHCTSKQ